MNSLEFTTKIDHGVIHLPQEFEEYGDAEAHVVVTVTEPEEIEARKKRLLAAFRNIQKADVFKSIEDPSEWLHKLRNEWD